MNLSKTHLWCSVLIVTTSTADNAAKVSSDSQDSIEKVSLRPMCLGSGGSHCYHIKDICVSVTRPPPSAQWVHSATVAEAGSGEHRLRAKGNMKEKTTLSFTK